MKSFGGPVLVLDRDDINTDEIIPARYLTELSKEALKPHLLEDLALPGFDPGRDIPGKKVIIAGRNFGCGSSREHAPWALEANGIHVVLAKSFARIFRRNMYNCGMLAIECGDQNIDQLLSSRGGFNLDLDIKNNTFRASGSGIDLEGSFSLEGFDRSLIEAGGWIEYVDIHY